MSKQKQYILIFSIANVQYFITQARKTQDLSEGSSILSKLVKQVIDFVITDLGEGNVKLVTPAATTNRSIPNRFVVLVTASEEKAAGLPKAIYNFVNDEILTIAEMKFDALASSESVLGQLKNFLDIHCILYPREANYYEDYKNAEAYLGAVKNTRLFNQIQEGGETGRKCILCGERNVVFYRKNNRETRLNKSAEDIKWGKLYLREGNETVLILEAEKGGEFTLGELKRGEGICSVCALKRFKLHNSFPSTAEIAMQSLLNIDTDNAIEKYKKTFRAPFNWQFIYEENIQSRETLNHLGYSCTTKEAREISRAHREMKISLNNDLPSGLGEFPKYYAMVFFDGDNMGELFSGENLVDSYRNEEENLLNFQTDLSRALLQYASQLSTRYKEDKHQHKAQMVYSGGDDFLGFINLQYLFDELQFLRDSFENTVSKTIFEKYKDYLNIDSGQISFSAGIVIAHYKTPLSIVIQQTLEAEKIAKDTNRFPDKNAFCISLVRRGGNTVNTSWNWSHQNDQDNKILPQIKTLWEFLTKEQISPRFYGTLHQEFSLLLDKGSIESNGDIRPILEYELTRLLIRAKAEGFKEQKIKDWVTGILAFHNSRKALRNDFNNLLRLLEIIAFIERHTHEQLESEKTTTA